jgi:hypothetical protein
MIKKRNIRQRWSAWIIQADQKFCLFAYNDALTFFATSEETQFSQSADVFRK